MKTRSMLEKPKEPRHSSSTSADEAKIKDFLERHEVVLPLLEAILADAFECLTHYRRADYLRDVATLRRRYSHEGLSFATKTLPELFNALLQHLESGTPSYPSFKLVKGGKHPVFLRQLFAMALSVDNGEDRVTAVKCLYQLCSAFKKLKGPYRRSTLQKQLWSFVETDQSLKELDFLSEPCFPILARARKMVKAILEEVSPEFDPGLFVPRPGPGATNTPRQKHVRFRPHVLYTQLDDVFPYEDWFYSHPWDIVTEPTRYTALERRDAPSSRFKFVDKTYSKPRGICIEELETQYLQQAIKHCLYNRIEAHPLTRGRVNFTDQSINGDLAVESSASQKYATIDMSEASDRISRTLVRYLFRDCEDLLEALMATSSRTIQLPEGIIDFIDELPVEKFAPMGSAVCFPVMSLVHFVLIRAILSYAAVPQCSARDVYVYGDDIIVRTECANAVYDYLPLFGMKLNEEKSYYRSSFRESCGQHAFNGVPITPTYFKYVPESQSHGGVIVSLLETERSLFYNGFTRTAAALRSMMSQTCKKVRCQDLPFVRPKSEILGWIREDEDAPLKRALGHKRRWDQDSQQWFYKVRVHRVPTRSLPSMEQHEAYLRWLTTGAGEATVLDDNQLSFLFNGPVLPKSDDQRNAVNVTDSLDEHHVRFAWKPESAF